jgi:16S rRNA (adenine1518-N6/adenine1519-N6)-dimethyltransferase
MTLLVQKEVASRIARSAKPYSAKATKGKESILSLSVKAYGTPSYVFTVPRGAFMPAPKVDSAVLGIQNISRSAFKTKKEEQKFFDILHAGFAHKRKFVRNNLSLAGFDAQDIPEKARAEDLSLKTWLALAKT